MIAAKQVKTSHSDLEPLTGNTTSERERSGDIIVGNISYL